LLITPAIEWDGSARGLLKDIAVIDLISFNNYIVRLKALPHLRAGITTSNR
jgi:hypothetical protein